MSLHIKAVTKALSYPLYPPNLARRRFRIPDILFTAGTITTHAPKAPELEQTAVSGVFSPWLASSPPLFVTSQPKWNPKIGHGTTRRNVTILISETQEGNIFTHFFFKFQCSCDFSCATSTQHPHTHGKARTEGRRDGRSMGGLEGWGGDGAIARRLCAGQTIA